MYICTVVYRCVNLCGVDSTWTVLYLLYIEQCPFLAFSDDHVRVVKLGTVQRVNSCIPLTVLHLLYVIQYSILKTVKKLCHLLFYLKICTMYISRELGTSLRGLQNKYIRLLWKIQYDSF